MDTQTAGALLPAFLLITPLVLAVIDVLRIGRISHDVPMQQNSWPAGTAQI
jgi:hypothetical protein